MNFSFIIKNENELDEIAQQVLRKYNLKIFLFYGEMGVGKTRFIKSLCKGLDVLDVVSSPTFSIVNEYSSEQGQQFYHFDFYRIDDAEEVLEIGVEEYFYSGAYCWIEWAERIPEYIPDTFQLISIQVDEKGWRVISISKIVNGAQHG